MSPRLAPSVRRSRLLLVAVAALLAPAALPGAASADDAAGNPADTIVGQLVQAWPEQSPDAGGGTTTAGVAEQPLSWVETAAGETVPVDTGDIADLPVGATVQLALGGSVADPVGDGARSVLDGEVVEPPPAAPTTASDAVTVVRVVPPGGTEDTVTVQQMVDAVDGPVADYWAGQTGGAIQLGVTGSAADWVYTQAGCSDAAGLWDEAADAVGFVPGPGRHLFVYVTSAGDPPNCTSGLSEVGSGPGSGGRFYVRSVLPALIAHELGHNFGLLHSSGRQCDGIVDAAALDSDACRTAAYRDYYDVMGASWEHLGSLNAVQADRLGLLPASALESVAAGGPTVSLALAPLAAGAGIRVARLSGPDGDYWLEYRTPTGQDSWISGNRFGLDGGVLLHRAGELADTALLLDGTPSTSSGWDDDLQAALPLGVPIEVDGGAFTVTVTGLDPAAATVVVQATADSADPADPTAAAIDPAGNPASTVLPGTAGAGAPAEPASGSGSGARPGAVAPAATSPDPGSAVPPAASATPSVTGWRPTPFTTTDLAPRASSSSLVWLWALIGLSVVGAGLLGGRTFLRARAVRR